MDAPLAIILEMIKVIFNNTIGTLLNLGGLFGSLSQSLGAVGSVNPAGFIFAVVILGLVILFLGKFFLRSWKLLAIMFIIGFVVILMLAIGTN
jgi:hypothetical protein